MTAASITALISSALLWKTKYTVWGATLRRASRIKEAMRRAMETRARGTSAWAASMMVARVRAAFSRRLGVSWGMTGTTILVNPH